MMPVLEVVHENPDDAREGTKNQNQKHCAKRNNEEAKEECKKGGTHQRNRPTCKH